TVVAPTRRMSLAGGDSGSRTRPRKRLNINMADAAVVCQEGDEPAVWREGRRRFAEGTRQKGRGFATGVTPDIGIAAFRVFAIKQRPPVRRPVEGRRPSCDPHKGFLGSGSVGARPANYLPVFALGDICDEFAISAPERLVAFTVADEQPSGAALQIEDPYLQLGPL